MVTFVCNNEAIVGHEIGYLSLPLKSLQHCDVQKSRGLVPTTSYHSDRLSIHVQKEGELLTPLLQERRAMHKNERIYVSLCDEPRRQHGLAEAGRCYEDTIIVFNQLLGRGLLFATELAMERERHRCSRQALVFDFELNRVRLKKDFQIFEAPARNPNVVGKLLRTTNHPWFSKRRKAHRLCGIEFGILKRCQPNDAVGQRRIQRTLLQIEQIAPDDSQVLRQGARNWRFSTFSRRG
ncbi:MAG: hypothetical protein AMXMBFR82_41460 [Candidatus Hydrogenedentota bacterium]